MAFHDFRYDDHDLDRTATYNYAGRPKTYSRTTLSAAAKAAGFTEKGMSLREAIIIGTLGVATICSWWWL